MDNFTFTLYIIFYYAKSSLGHLILLPSAILDAAEGYSLYVNHRLDRLASW